MTYYDVASRQGKVVATPGIDSQTPKDLDHGKQERCERLAANPT